MIRREVRQARKQYRCDGAVSAYCRTILPGDHYLLHVASPNHGDLGNDHWWTLRACRACAEVYGTTWDEPVHQAPTGPPSGAGGRCPHPKVIRVLGYHKCTRCGELM